MCRRPNKN